MNAITTQRTNGRQDIKIEEVAIKDKRITNEEKTNAQPKESSSAINQLKARTGKKLTAEEKLEFYKSVQTLRHEIRMQQK